MIIIVAAMVSSCVTKPYKTPQTAQLMDSLYRVLENRVDTTKNEADVSWQQFFTDPILVGYVAEALENNIDMRIAIKNIEKANSQLRSARSAYFPSISGSVGYGGEMTSNYPSVMAATNQVNLQLGWEIDLWGKIASAKRSSYASLLQQHDVVQAMQTTIVAQIASMYYTLVAYDAEVKVITETIANRRDYLAKTRDLKESSKVNEVAVQQAIAQLAEVNAALPSMQLAIIQTENAFKLLLGRPSGEIVRHPVINIMDAKLVTDIGYPAQLLVNRPDVRAAENSYRAAHEMWNVSRAAMYPALTISAEGSISDITNSHFGVLNLLGGLTQPIFNGRKLRTQREVAKLTAEQAELNFRKAILTAGQEVSNALAKQLKTKEMAIAKVVQLRSLKLAYEYSMELFDKGYATYIDVLIAQTGVYNIEMSLIQTYLDNLVARIELYKALGGGAKNS